MELSVKLEVERNDNIVEVEVEGIFINAMEDNPYESGWTLEDIKVSPKNIELTEKEFDHAAEELYQKLEYL